MVEGRSHNLQESRTWEEPMAERDQIFSLLSLSASSPCFALTLLLLLATSSADPLPTPTLSTHPTYPFYYEGERVSLLCSAPTQKAIVGFRFFNQSGDQISQNEPFSLPFSWLQLTATNESAGRYTCLYLVEDSGREVSSLHSLPLPVKVEAAPVAPTLSLDPQQEIYKAGRSLKLLCSIPSATEGVKEIQYYADFGFAVSIPVRNVRNYSYELGLTGEESGSYSCAYFVFQSNRPVRSGRSPWVNVSVKGYKLLWIREIAVGGSFFTINGLIFFFSHHLMKKREVQD